MSRVTLLAMMALFATFFATATSAHAQPSEEDLLCYPDCPEHSWNTVGVSNWAFTLTTCGSSCQVRAWYVFRNACPPDNYVDIQIYKIEYVSGTCAGCFPGDWLREVAQYLLTAGILPFSNPVAGSCINYYRVSVAGCWKQTNVGSIPTIRPCQGSGCCVARYRVCKDLNGNVSIVTEYQRSTATSCEVDAESGNPGFPINPIIGDFTTSSCFAMCDNIVFSDTSGKPVTGAIKADRINDVQIFNLGLEMTILCKPEVAAKGLLELNDVSGRKVDELRPVLDGDGVYRFVIDRGRLVPGVYFYRVSFGGCNFTTGTFVSR